MVRLATEEVTNSKDIYKMRKKLNMQPIVAEKCKCLSCGEIFKSKNKYLFRICKRCKELKHHREISL